MHSPNDAMRDERGAILVIALCFAIFGVAILFFVVGTAQAVLLRERLQDTVDAAALSGAITRARLMNVIVLINLVMSALVAILLTLKLVEGLAIVGIALAAALAFFTGGSSLAAIPPCNALRSTMKGLFDSLKPNIFEILEVLHDVSSAVVDVSPVAMEVAAIAEINGSDRGAAAGGFVAPTGEKIPVVSDEYSKLCENAGQLVEVIARKPFEALPPLEPIVGALLSPLSDLAGAMSQWFCGDGGYHLPDLSRDVQKAFPEPENAAACTGEVIEGVHRGQEEYATSAACDATEASRAAAAPDAQGNCQTDCGANGPYEYAVQRARIDCDPTGNPRPSVYRYQLQQVRVIYTWNGAAWEKGVPEIVSSVVAETEQPPCGPSEVGPGVAPGYNPAVHPENDPTRINLLCTAEGTPDLPYPDPDADPDAGPPFRPDPVVYEYRQVPQIFACKRMTRTVVANSPADEQLPPNTQEGRSERDEDDKKHAKSPMKVKDSVRLGSEPFQVRAAVFAKQGERGVDKLVRLSLWGAADPDNPLALLRSFGGFSVAQAEYYYAGGGGDRDAWMWNMAWRARLKRFDLSNRDDATDQSGGSNDDNQSNPTSTFSESCGLHAAAQCPGLLATMALAKDLLAH